MLYTVTRWSRWSSRRTVAIFQRINFSLSSSVTTTVFPRRMEDNIVGILLYCSITTDFLRVTLPSHLLWKLRYGLSLLNFFSWYIFCCSVHAPSLLRKHEPFLGSKGGWCIELFICFTSMLEAPTFTTLHFGLITTSNMFCSSSFSG